MIIFIFTISGLALFTFQILGMEIFKLIREISDDFAATSGRDELIFPDHIHGDSHK